jgi:mono/diheme cytochrome c family protein
MSRRKKQVSGVRCRVSGVRRRGIFGLPLIFFCLLFSSACRMDMQDQPRYEVYEKSEFFKDGISSRHFPQGTVPRGFLREDTELFSGKRAGATNTAGGGQNQGGNGNTSGGTANTQTSASYPNDVDTFPFPVTAEAVARGRDRYNIFCSMCHGATGYGDGMIVRRGYRRPPSFHTDQLRQAPVGHFFDVMTNGWGAMPSYSAQVAVPDRWAIVAYIRALQLSQNQQPGGGTTSNPSAATNPPVTERPQSENGGHR